MESKKKYLIIEQEAWSSEINNIKPLKSHGIHSDANPLYKQSLNLDYELSKLYNQQKQYFHATLNNQTFDYTYGFEIDRNNYEYNNEQYLKNGVNKQALKKLMNALPHIYLDLHGVNIESAYVMVHNFINNAYHNQYKYVYIIHGKGLSSPNQLPILKPKVLYWLRNIPTVLAFTNAKLQYGGSGASIILIKSKS